MCEGRGTKGSNQFSQAPLQQINLRVMGMHCAGCARRVEGALSSVAEAVSVRVDLVGGRASVTASEAEDIAERLVLAVRAAGFDAEAISADGFTDCFTEGAVQRRELRCQRQAVAVVIVLAALVMTIESVFPVVWGHGTKLRVGGLTWPAMTAGWTLQLVLVLLMAAGSAGASILRGGLRAAVHRAPDMDLLVSMGVTTAFVSSIYGVFVAGEHGFVHLHAAAMILALVALGRYLESRAKGRASAAIAALARRAPRDALVRRGDRLVTVPVEQIVVGDLISVPVHSTIPTDGEVVEGAAAVDESLMTGEALPVRREEGGRVLGGTRVTDGMLMIRATAVGSRSALGRIVQLVADAQASKTRMQQLADRVAGVFASIVIAAAAVTFAVWLAFGGAAALSSATRAAVAVLVVACPCALGLATPTVVSVACGLAALRGILVREAGMLEALGGVNLVVWDKTGTLTTGLPTISRILTVEGWKGRPVLAIAAAVEQFSSHPLARTIVARARRDEVDFLEPASFEFHPGRGVAASLDGRPVAVGSEGFLASTDCDILALRSMITRSASAGETIVCVAVDGKGVGAVLLSDTARPRAAEAIRRLRELGVESELLTGDREESVRAVAGELGLEHWAAGVTPEGKIERIRELRGDGHRVAMVGDGVNDAAALAAADVGIAFATGADVAVESAGINLVGSAPMLVADAVELARASLRVIRQNLFWAFLYNVLMIPLAAMGKLPPALAAAAMMLSSLTVVLNALRLPGLVGWRGTPAR